MENRKTQINEKRCVFSKCIDVDLDYQENLLSYNDDLLKIVRCSVNNYILNSVYLNSTLTVYGKSRIFITYISDATKCLTSAEFEEDFEKSIPIEGEYQDITADVTVCNKYNNFRIINQRRIDIHNSFQLNVCAYTPCCVEMVESTDNVLIDKEEVKYISRVGSAYTKTEFETEESVTDSVPIKKIINVFSGTDCKEVKIIDDKMLVKTQLRFSVLYTTDSDDEKIERCEKTTEVNTIVDIAGIRENDIPVVKTKIGNLFVKSKTDKNNELTVIEFIGDINVCSTVYRQCSSNLSRDSYSVSRNTENIYNTVNLDTSYKVAHDSFSDTLRFEFDSVTISQVLDLEAELVDENTVELNAFILDSKSELQFITARKKIDITKAKQIQAFISSFDFVISSDNAIELRIVISYISIDYERKSFNIVSDVEIKDELDFDSPALVIYFADENERLWDIAKTFKTTVELIKQENELTKDVLDTRRVLLIPGV